MACSRRDPLRRPFVAVALLVLVAFAPGPGRTVLHFLADFDPHGSGWAAQEEFLAKGGKIVVSGPPDVFATDLQAPGQGVLTVGENPFGSAAILTGTLDEPVTANQLDFDMDLSAVGDLSDLVVSFVDDDGGEMIDVTFDDDDGGVLHVGGQTVPFDPEGLDPGAGSFHLDLRLKQHLFGMRSWSLTLTGAFGVQTLQGFLPGVGALSLERVRILRPGNTRGGSWELDDLIVSSPVDETLTNDS